MRWVRKLREAQTSRVVNAVDEAVRRVLEGIDTATSSRSSSSTPEAELQDRIRRAVAESSEIAQRLEAIERRATELATALAHGIEHEDRRERRIQATVKRARKQLAELGVEDPGLEAEFDLLPEVDGDAGEQGGLLLMPGEVEDGPRVEESSVPGVSREQLERVRGFGR